MIVLDTTVLSYAVGDEHPFALSRASGAPSLCAFSLARSLRAPCRRLLAAHGDGQIEATTTIEVVQEFAHVRARRRPRADAVTLARHYLTAFSLLITDSQVRRHLTG